jgi:hypothetical protein
MQDTGEAAGKKAFNSKTFQGGNVRIQNYKSPDSVD